MRVQHALALQQLLESVPRLFFDQIPQIILVEAQLLRQHFQRKRAVILFDDGQGFGDDLIVVPLLPFCFFFKCARQLHEQ